VINDLFTRIGLIEENVAWTAQVNTALPAAIVTELWRGLPFFTILLLASLQQIPDELYESCYIDGGGRWIAFTRITLPFLSDTIIITTLLRGVWEFKNVNIIYALTGGGPAHRTTTLSMYQAEKALHSTDFGYGSAIGVIMFFCLLAFAMTYLKITRFGEKT
jgi:multiple sugar transport system permease protein